jgi:hypothetical protein
LAASAQAAAPPQGQGEWNFQVTLDGRPIGSHRFSVTPAQGASGPGFSGTVRSVADFNVKMLGLTVYRYHHEATATWSGGCLATLDASTDDNGSPHRVVAQRKPGALSVVVGTDPGAAATDMPGCVTDYAYWSPSLREQSRLLDPQWGLLDDVRITPLASKPLTVEGAQVDAKGWRIAGPKQPVDVWYAESDGRWIGLDSKVRGGRVLSYRLP